MGKQLTIPIFDAFVDGNELGLFGISYVDRPAIMEELVAFRDDKQYVYFSSNEKHEIVSPLAIPNQLIYRATEDGIPYYIRMSEETIRQMTEKFLAKGKWNQWTLMHENMDAPMEDRVQDGIYMKRIWIIDDPSKDDANVKYGFNLPKGTLMVHAKIMNRSIWSKIKSGEIRGLSLEAFFRLKNLNKALQISYSKMENKIDFNEKRMNLFNRFVAFLNEVSVEADGIATEAKKDMTNSGEIELKYFIDDEHYFVVDGDGIVRDENGEQIAEGEYKLADGNVFVVDSNSKFVETKAVGEEEDKVEAPIAETFEEEKEDEKKDKEDMEKPKGEDRNGDSKPGYEDVDVDDEKYDETPREKDCKDVPRDDDEKLEEAPICEEPKDEDNPLVNAIPYEINGVEYLLPKEVIDFIESLKTSKIEVEEKLTKMSEQTPSASPIGTVVKTSDEVNDINSRISSLSMFKGFSHRV